jgi:hypothetical protein
MKRTTALGRGVLQGATRTLLIGGAALSLTGCITTTAAQSLDGRAYIVSGSTFGTHIYACSAATRPPVCRKVSEVSLP